MSKRLCDLDCFNCKYKDCINSTLTSEDYKLSKSLDKDIIKEDTPDSLIRIRESHLKWYHNNKETELARMSEYRENNRERLREESRQYHQEHREEDNQRNLARYYSNHEENKKKSRDSKRARYQENIEYHRQKQREYRQRVKERSQQNAHSENKQTAFA